MNGDPIPADTGRECARCHKSFETLTPLPKALRTLMKPANEIFPVFNDTAMYCAKCRRAMLTPTAVLILIALGILSIVLLRWLGIIK
jgi:hypothetical protein